ECLEALAKRADLIVVSATATEALEREWRENGLMDQVSLVCGQEAGTKRGILASLVHRYPAGHALMIGDAPGDLDAAHANGARFYPIVPAGEADSWKAFAPSLEAFLRGEYDESPLLAQFLERLPEQPTWKAVG
nr:HAD family hydrolase [Clostridia bacterium]